MLPTAQYNVNDAHLPPSVRLTNLMSANKASAARIREVFKKIFKKHEIFHDLQTLHIFEPSLLTKKMLRLGWWVKTSNGLFHIFFKPSLI